MDRGMHTGMILIDLSKALNILDHKVVLEKMICLGFKPSVLNWFESYASNRKFLVSLDNAFLEAGILNCGIPQGSILRPFLYLIYINDSLLAPQSLSESGSCFYDHVRSIFNQEKVVYKTENVLTKEFLTLSNWFVENKLQSFFYKNILYKNIEAHIG